jgi:flagellar L-ring protein precursor FlgH
VFIEGPCVHEIRDYSWHYIASPQPRVIKEQDLITILVREISEVSVDSRFDRQRRSTLLAELKEFIRIGETRNLENAAENEPTIDANLSGRLNSNGRVSEKEEVTYRITATVAEVLPNGNLVLEAQKEIQTNKELWKYTLTGIIRSQDINRDNTALSENIANLQIKKTQSGKVYDSTKRPWGTRLYDLLFPF